MKSILMSIKPYYGFLIIAKAKGWDLKKYGLHEKTVEVRKGVPTSTAWNKKSALYFSKDKKSLARVPEEYRGEVAKLCGKIVCEFVCDYIDEVFSYGTFLRTCLSEKELENYLKNSDGYGWHISDLKIYDKSKELGEFTRFQEKHCKERDCTNCNKHYVPIGYCEKVKINRPPQSWCYVEEL